jgi:hypothetical protein
VRPLLVLPGRGIARLYRVVVPEAVEDADAEGRPSQDLPFPIWLALESLAITRGQFSRYLTASSRHGGAVKMGIAYIYPRRSHGDRVRVVFFSIDARRRR